MVCEICDASFFYLCVGCQKPDSKILSIANYMRKQYVWDWEESTTGDGRWAQYQVLVCPTCRTSWQRAAKRDVSRMDVEEITKRMRDDLENEEYYRLVKDRTFGLLPGAKVIKKIK